MKCELKFKNYSLNLKCKSVSMFFLWYLEFPGIYVLSTMASALHAVLGIEIEAEMMLE